MVKKYDLKYSFILLILLTGMIFRILSFFIQDKSADKIFNDSIYSVVEVKAVTADIGESFGSAVFVKNDGTLITNAHVVTYKDNAQYFAFENIEIRFSVENNYRKVTLIKYDLEKDLAILKLNDTNCKFKTVKFGDTKKIKTGEQVFAVGNLSNVGISLTEGIISNPSLNIDYNGITRNVIQCDLTIAEGNSGGALLDNKGKLIGITTFRLKDNSKNIIYGICYQVPVNEIVEYIN